MLLQSGQLPNKEECGTEAGADPAQNLSGAKSGTLKHFFDLETGGGGSGELHLGVWQWKLGVVPLKIIYNHHIIISYHVSLVKHGGPSGNKPDLQVAMLTKKTTKLFAVVVVTKH